MYHFIPIERAIQRHEVHSRCYATVTATFRLELCPHVKHPLPMLPLSCSPAPGNFQSNFCVCESDYSIGLAKEAHLGFSVGTLASPADASHRWDRIEFILCVWFVSLRTMSSSFMLQWHVSELRSFKAGSDIFCCTGRPCHFTMDTFKHLRIIGCLGVTRHFNKSQHTSF